MLFSQQTHPAHLIYLSAFVCQPLAGGGAMPEEAWANQARASRSHWVSACSYQCLDKHTVQPTPPGEAQTFTQASGSSLHPSDHTPPNNEESDG